MKLVKADEACSGQKVARDVTDLRGNLLFRAGTVLTPDLLATCKQRNVSHLFLEADALPGTLSPADLEARKQQIARDVDRMFSGVDAAPLMAALREASKRHLIGALK